MMEDYVLYVDEIQNIAIFQFGMDFEPKLNMHVSYVIVVLNVYSKKYSGKQNQMHLINFLICFS